jgi:transposase InsO family protein
MNEEVIAKKKRNIPPRGESADRRLRRFTKAEKLKAVRLYLDEGFSMDLVCEEVGTSKSSLTLWLDAYRHGGEAGLEPLAHGSRRERLPAAITEKIIELKKENPTFGIKRISQLLRRWFFLPASPETVRQRLHEAKMMEEAPPPKKRNITRPRFFERATPNQMWQTDIFTFRLGGRYAYLIAFMDDYSRFIVGADLFRSPTGPSVIEVYRVAIGEYQPPKEMLTDNGRQYTSWRGTSRFEAELKKDRVAHFKSRPHHPMTLGKIERFWETIWQEFLCRAQFDSFEAARERIKLWIKYYNHKRPHQGIEGLCPADRFFEIQTQLRSTIEAGIQENLLELALRGKPQAPFYMVGRMDGQSVVLRAEKGKLKLSVSDHQNQEQELTYDLNQDSSEQRKAGTEKENTNTSIHGTGKGPGSVGSMDGEVQASRSLPAVENQPSCIQSMAAAGDGRNASGSGSPGQPDQGRSPESAFTATPAEQAEDGYGGQDHQSTGTDKQDCQHPPVSGKNGVDECQSQTEGGGDLASPLGPVDGHRGSSDAGHLPPAVLPMGTTGTSGTVDGSGRPADRSPQEANRSGEGATPTPGATTGEACPGPATEGTVARTPETMGGEGEPSSL